MKYEARPMIGRRNKSWHIVNEFGGLIEEFDGTRKQAEARAAEVERERSHLSPTALYCPTCLRGIERSALQNQGEPRG